MMSTLTYQQQEPAIPVQAPVEPPLDNGDRLSRAEFERRYQAHPEIKKAELIEGVVYVPSPTRFEQQGSPHFNIIGWLGVYQAATPGVRGGNNATVRLDFENEVQPDVLLMLEPDLGGQSTITEDDYLEGPPEFLIEVAVSSASYDLHDKRRVYARNGVKEYLVIQICEQRLDWFVLVEGVYQALEPDENGILKSQFFAGLWLQPAALWAGDLAKMLETLQEGLASVEHGAFLERLKEKQND
jgi:Uma2 family endonuclease